MIWFPKNRIAHDGGSLDILQLIRGIKKLSDEEHLTAWGYEENLCEIKLIFGLHLLLE